MQAGRIVQVGDGETLYRTPAHPFVASFLGRVNRLATSANGMLDLGGVSMQGPTMASSVLVRPEDIEIGNPQSGWGRAEVQRRNFLGDRVQLTLDVAGQGTLLADVERDHAAREGEVVGIRIAPEHLMPMLETDTR
nr:TOBE domain-containing protein [Diaphorobacter aerolatus]